MKKTAIIIAIALGFSITTLNATPQVSSNTVELTINKPSVSPFCMSIVKGDTEAFKKFIELGADINAKSNGMTPVMYAARFNRVDILKILVEKGADINTRSEKGLTAEKYAKMSNADEALTFIKNL